MNSSETAISPEVQHQEIIENIKTQLLKRFGTVFNERTMEMENRTWEQINIMWHCGEVSRITQKIVGGQIEEIIHNKHNAHLIYINPEGTTKEIADGATQAIHSYVITVENKIWDPTLEIWGDIHKDEYLSRIKKT